MHLDLTKINKARPRCARVKVQVDLAIKKMDYMEIEIVGGKTMESRIERIKVQFDFYSKYYKNCKLQGHNEEECIVFHLE